MPGGLQDHRPPGVPSVMSDGAPIHTLLPPEIAAGPGFTATDWLTVHPAPREYVTIVDDPGVIPNSTPLNEPIIAVAGTLLLQVPPGIASDRDNVLPAQTVDEPMIGPGALLTVTTITARHPDGSI